MDSERSGGWLQVFSGKKFWPLDPRAEDIDIRDIAHALSQLCRFGGHTRQFYSVAEHSVRVSLAVHPEHALAGLLHDASEAYLVDVPKPIKNYMPDYVEAEEKVMHILSSRFGFSWPPVQDVLNADITLLLTEARDLMTGGLGPGWVFPADVALREKIVPMLPIEAESAFLARFEELTLKC